MRLALLIGIVGVLAPGAASADAITPDMVFPPAPTDCAQGARAFGGGHGVGPRCLPATCASDADCGAHGPCEARGLCLRTIPGGHNPPYDVVSGACGANDACPDGERCARATYCSGEPAPPRPSVLDAPAPRSTPAPAERVATPPAADAPPAASGGCSATTGGSALAALSLALAGLWLARRRAPRA